MSVGSKTSSAAGQGDPDTGFYASFRITLVEVLAGVGRVDEARAQLKRAFAATKKGSDTALVFQLLLAELDRR